MSKNALEYSDLKHHAIPFPDIREDDYLPKLKSAIEAAKSEINAIANCSDEPTFENTMLALETAGEDVSLVSSIFYNLNHANTSDKMQQLAQEFGPILSAYSNDITLNAKLFQRIESVFQNQSKFDLDTEEKRLLEETYQDFVRNGARLSDSEKEELRKVDAEISQLNPKFSENILKATNAFELWIDNEADLEGLPGSAVEAYKMAAKEKGQDNKWLVTLHAPSFIPFTTYAKNRELREKLTKAFGSRAFNDEFDNQEVIKSILKLREIRAGILGFKTHAEYILQKRMAETPARVFEFLDQIKKPSIDKAKADVQEVADFAKAEDGIKELQRWDFAYYSEKLKQKKYDFDSEELRPYFKLENVIAGAFEHASRLYGLTFKENKEYPVYHEDVRTFEVSETDTGDFIGLFYTDFFPRSSKSGGAWQTTFIEQGLFKGEVIRPHVSIVCNFTKPTESKPSLLTLDEVLTLFHEFGHALHSLLSKCKFTSTGGTNVYWDFVELPSQIMENWVMEKEALDVFAKHYETGELIPQELADKMKRSEQFQAGYMAIRQVSFATVDMLYHTTPAAEVVDVSAFEKKNMAEFQTLPDVEGSCFSCGFSHIFAGGYSAGYYSYKWAEVLDADAFEYFKEKGLFNKEVATKFKNEILSRGGTEHPMELYKRFRGREPDIKALLKRDGLI